MKNRVDFYTEKRFRVLCRRNRFWRVFLLVFFLISLAACIVMCTKTNTANAVLMEKWVIGTAVVSGWILLFVYMNIYRPGKAEAMHMEHTMAEERLWEDGELSLTKEMFHIPGSIWIRKVSFTTDQETRLLNVKESSFRQLKSMTGRVRVATVGKYLAAVEKENGEGRI